MGKEYEKIRQEISKKYKMQIEELKADNKLMREENIILKEKLENVEHELSIKTEWIERMQEFCNMTDDDRKTLIESEKIKSEVYEKMNVLASGIGGSGLFHYLNGIL